MLDFLRILFRTVLLLYLFIPNTVFAGCLNVTSPSSGDNWKTTQEYSIEWNTTSTKPTVDIYLYKNGSRKSTIVSGTANDGQYTWTIPANTLLNKNDEGNQYYISMCTDDCCGDGQYFSIYFPPPSTPGGFSVSSVTSSSASLSWGTSYGATGYEIYDCDTNSLVSSNYDWFYLGGTVYNLDPETTYQFKMRAVNTSGQSPFTVCVNATTLPGPPETPTGFSATAQTPNSISLSWNSVDDATGYDIQTCTGSSVGSTSLTSYLVTGLNPETTYSYKVRATNTGGNSDFTGCESATTPTDIPPTYTISGTVADENADALAGVTVALSGFLDVTDSSGNYTIEDVPEGTSGDLTASKTGCAFSSPIAISNLSANLTGKDFEAACSFVVSGRTKKGDGTAIANATVTFTDQGSVQSASDGAYSKTVPGGWTGNVCATKDGCDFSCEYISNILEDMTGTDLICTLSTYKVSGYTKRYNGEAVSGVTVSFSGGLSSVVSGSNGYYEQYVEHGWSGTVSASKSGFKFSSESLSNVTSESPGNNVYGDYYPRTGTSASASVKATSWNTRYSEQQSKPCDKYERYCGDPVDTSSGAQLLEYELLKVQGVIPVSFSIAYNSLVVSDQGSVGKGWSFNYGFGATIEETDDDAVNIHWSKNRANRFNHNGDGTYSSLEDACRYDKLVKNEDDSFTLARQDKTVYEFTKFGLLSELKDSQGRSLQFLYDAYGNIFRISEPVSGVSLDFAYNAQGLLEKATDPLNREATLLYDENGRLETITDPDGHDTTFTYNAEGQILTAVNAEGHQLFDNTFDAQGRIVAQDDGLATNNPITVSYDESQDGKIVTTVTDRNGESRVYTYDEQYRLLEKTDELGNTSAVYTYDEDGNRTSASDGNGHTTHFDYDDDGNMTSVTDAAGNTTQMTYDANRNLTSTTDALGKTVAYEYDGQNRLTKITDPLGNIIQYTYNTYGQVLTETTPEGNLVQYEYENGLLSKVVLPEGNKREMFYDAAGRIVSMKDGDGNATTISYDPSCPGACRAQSITDPLGNSVEMTYDSRGSLLTFTDKNGNLTRYEYDANGNMTRMIDALNQTTQYEYDGEDRLVKVIDARANASSIAYDAKGRTILLTDALGNSRSMEYDDTFNVKTVKDAYATVVQSLDYDVSDNLIQVKDALDNAVAFEYDELNRLKKSIDPMSRVQQFAYDDLGSLIASIDPAGGVASQAFDKDGILTSVADPMGNQTVFSYDANGRLVAETSATGDQVQYAYNARDLMQSVTNARGHDRQMIYDAAGRLIRSTDPDGIINYTYDANGNLLTVGDANGAIVRQYDALDRVTRYTDARGNVIQYEYDSVGNLTGLTYPDGKKVVYGYDNANRLVSVTDWDGRQTAYSYDKENRLVQTDRPNGTSVTRTYNSAGQLTQQKDVESNGDTIIQYDFTYDSAGNITNETATPEPEPVPPTPATMTYGTANRLATYNGKPVSHDADGNMVRGPLDDGMANFTFDSRNRLRQAGSTLYEYDAENHRIGVADGDSQTSYVVNPLPELSQVLVREEHDGAKTYYVYGIGLIGQEQEGAYRCFHYDLRGSTVAITDENENVTHRYAYGAYGEVSVLIEENRNPFRYVGRYGVMLDRNGLCDMRARYYCRKIGRFLAEDPLWDINLYTYGNNNPLSMIDPIGNRSEVIKINRGTASQEVYLKHLKSFEDELCKRNEEFYKNKKELKEGSTERINYRNQYNEHQRGFKKSIQTYEARFNESYRSKWLSKPLRRKLVLPMIIRGGNLIALPLGIFTPAVVDAPGPAYDRKETYSMCDDPLIRYNPAFFAYCPVYESYRTARSFYDFHNRYFR